MFDGLISRLDMDEETISELEDTSAEFWKTRTKTEKIEQNIQGRWDVYMISTIWHFGKSRTMETINKSVVLGIGEGC